MMLSTVLVMVLSSASALPASHKENSPAVEPAQPAPVRVLDVRPARERRLPLVQSAVVGGGIALLLGAPLLAFSVVVALVASVAMTIVLFNVLDFQHGYFKLSEDDKTNKNRDYVYKRNAWVWGRNSLAFSMLGMALGALATSIGVAALVGGLVVPE
jgi:hypothetical protein